MSNQIFKPLLPVLIVDDDPGVVEVVDCLLQHSGFKTATAGTGEEAVAWLRQHEASLLLTDLHLPDMMGWEIIPRLLQETKGPAPAFVVMTGRGDERIAVEMMQRGALDFVMKDADFSSRLPAVISRAVRQLEQACKLEAMEAAFKREHQFLSAIVETAGALVMVLDQEGRIIRFNRACESSSGYSAEHMIGRPVWKLIARPDELKTAREIFSCLKHGQESGTHENHWRAANGEDHLIAWTNTLLLDDAGEVEYVIATGIDITERRQLEKELLNIEESVQQRIGHDLHDDLCQRLAGIEIMSQVLEQQLGSKSKVMAGRAADISQLVRDAISHTLALARGLSPVVMEAEGLTAALQQLAESTKSIFGVACIFRCPEPVSMNNLSVATHLYRIAQEAVSNAVRHGEAQQIVIALVATPERVSLLVEDDGKGLPISVPKRHGMGLRIMRYRAGVIGGSLTVQKREESGTVVVCSVRVASGKLHEEEQEASR
jgi:PAS domain S-box-containing protein